MYDLVCRQQMYLCLASYTGEHKLYDRRNVDLLSQTYGKRNWRSGADCLRSSRGLWLPTTFHRSIFAGCIGFSKYGSPHTHSSRLWEYSCQTSCTVWNLLCPSNDTTQSQAGGNKRFSFSGETSSPHSPSPLIYSPRCYEWFCLFSLILNIAHY